jgi:hypothetical protein
MKTLEHAETEAANTTIFAATKPCSSASLLPHKPPPETPALTSCQHRCRVCPTRWGARRGPTASRRRRRPIPQTVSK